MACAPSKLLAIGFACVLAACKGPAGTDGAAGGPGTNGSNGLACWDLNGNGKCDLATEDANHDGKCDALDCQAAPTGTLSVTVVTAGGAAIAGALLITNPATFSKTTDAQGAATFANVPVGSYTVIASASGFAGSQVIAAVADGLTSTAKIALTAVVAANAAPTASATSSVQVGYGNGATMNATVADPDDGAAQLTVQWTQTGGAPATLTKPTPTTARFTMGALTDLYGDLPDRFGLLGINEGRAGAYTFDVKVTDPHGASATAKASAQAAEYTPGLPNVPIGIRQYLNAGKSTQVSWAWTMTPAAGSGATLENPTTRTPSFIPDVKGHYVITETISNQTLDVYAGSWQGIVNAYSDCTVCHNAQLVPDKFTPYFGTRHFKAFSDYVDGKFGSFFNESCLGCHTLGYSKAAQNGGFDDLAAANAWSMPAKLQAGNWSAIAETQPDLARRAAVQCESCHGPQDSPGHGMPSVRTTFAASVCAQCHDGAISQTPWWEASPHAQTELTARGTVEGSGTNAAHCGRCHTAQGYVAYVTQVAAGTPATSRLLKPDGSAADTIYLSKLGMDTAHVQPQTCATCHDPHDAKNPKQLRVFDNQPLAAGFTVSGVGAGALCMSCHNTRNGTFTNGNYVPRGSLGGDPPDYTAPHVPAQADILMGQSSYYITPGTSLSRHAAIEDTCVTCHVRLVPDSIKGPGTNHTFKADTSICKNCHGDLVNGEATQAAVQSRLDLLGSKLGSKLVSTITAAQFPQGAGSFAVRAWDPVSDTYSSSASNASGSNVTITQAPLSAIPVEVHGQQGFTLTFANDVTFTTTTGVTVTGKQVSFQLGALLNATGGTAIVPTTSDLVKAGWNWYLVHGDGSKGLHNPTYVFNILDASIAKL